MTDQVLRSIYYDAANPASYAGVDKLYKAARQRHPVSKREVKEWLSGELTYTLHKPARRRFKRNRIVVSHVNEQFQADLVDMQQFTGKNNQYRYILTAIDVFSKYAWAVPLKNKFGSSIRRGLMKIFKDRTPLNLQTDKGTEFTNKGVQDLLKRNGIHYFTSHNSYIKCAVVERFNRTLKARMFRYFTKIGKRRYIEVLPKLIDAYNNSVHRSIKMRPVDVGEHNEREVFFNLYGVRSRRDLLKPLNKPKLKVGDQVRQKYTMKPHERSYYPLWTDQTFTIAEAISGNPKPLYMIKDFKGSRLKQRHYPEEVQKVKGDLYRVEKILGRRRRNGRTQYLIKWLNYPNSVNSWEDAENVLDL
jgi:transposase InsO family protein